MKIIIPLILCALLIAPIQQGSTPTFSTYAGGSGEDTVRDAATDASGNIYVAGGTASANFVKTVGPVFAGVHDVFVRRYSATGQLLASRMIGGPNYDRAYAVELDAQGSVYVSGRAGRNFPTTAGAFQTTFQGYFTGPTYGEQNAFICKLSADLATVMWCSYEGPFDMNRDIAVDANGDIYAASNYDPANGGSLNPTWFANAFQKTPQGSNDGVVLKVKSDGTQVLWATLLGGSGFDSGTPSVGTDAAGNPYVLLYTDSPDIPTTIGAFDVTYNGGGDMYLVKLTIDGSNLVYATYFGGSSVEFSETHGLALDDAGNAYVAVTTGSTNIPTTTGAFDTTYNGTGGSGTGANTNYSGDGHVAKFSSAGVLLAATYYGGQFGEGIEGVSVGDDGRVYISGGTYSPNLPMVNAWQATKGAGADEFATIFSNDLTHLEWATFIGGANVDVARSSAVGRSFVVVGHSNGNNFPRVNADQGNFGGVADGTITVFATLMPTLTPTPTPTPTPSPSPIPNTLQFSALSYSIVEDCTSLSITVTRAGDTTGEATVSYATASGTASDRADFTVALGTLRFAARETEKTFVVLITEDARSEGTETASITLSNPIGATLGAPSIAKLEILDDVSEPGGNSIDDSAMFVCQQYHDFLNRQSDAGGQGFWTNEITSCGSDQQCIENKRINVSAAFFLSIEFQETGYLVYRMYKAAYGDTTSPNVPVPVPIIRLNEFLSDAQRIGQNVKVGIGDWQKQLENNKNAYAREFVSRQRFLNDYLLSMTPAQFVDQLNLNAGNVLSQAERDQLIAELTAATDLTQGRASVLRKVAEDAELRQGETNRAFVLMQYYGYLRRNSDDPQDTDFRGWEFWLNKLNQFNGNFVQAEMVKAFLRSIEFRQRFGQ